MAQQSTALTHFVTYSAAPEADSFEIATLTELREILAELREMDPSAEDGVEILVARDEDGYYFARRPAESREFAVLLPSSQDDPDCSDRGYGHHAHLSEDVYCPCGGIVALEISPISERGATGERDQYPITCRDAGEWWIHCGACGAEHILVPAAE